MVRRSNGYGVVANRTGDPPAVVSLYGVLVEESSDTGVAISSIDAQLVRVVVRATRPSSEGLYGDGVVVWATNLPSVAELHECTSENNVRAGVAVLGADVALSSTRLSCNAFDLSADPFNGRTPSLRDEGGNRCGCETDETCKAVSAALEPPPTLEPPPVP